MALTGSFAKTIAPGYRDIVGTTFESAAVMYSRLFHVEATERNYEDMFASTGVPRAVSKPEGAPISFYDPIEGNQKRVQIGAKAIGVQISRELWDDDLYKNRSGVRKSASMLARAYMETVEVDAFDVFNNGFGSTYTTTDGVGLFNTAHTRLDGGGTQANRPSTDIGLSLSSMRAGRNQFSKWFDDRGNRIKGNPKFLWTGIDLADRAEELLFTQGKPDTSDNTVNVTRGKLTPISTPYITSSTAWFITGPDHWLYFFWRTRPVMDAYDDRNTKTAKFTIWGRYGLNTIHWHDSYATTGS
jgi:hypothetical protein